MPKAPASITSPKIKKLAAKAFKSPSMLTTAETRELGASVVAHGSPTGMLPEVSTKKAASKKVSAKKLSAKKTVSKKTPAKKTFAKSSSAKKVSAKRS